MKKGLMLILMVSIGFGLVISDHPWVNAQETEEFTLEEITVTAQKREENQQKVPIAMEVLSGEDFKEQGRNDIDEILETISSVMIQAAEDGLRVSIRGMSNDNSPFMNISISTPTVAVHTDGVYTSKNTGNQNLYDIERMEVLFGPQSTLYASTSPGGIVNIVTAKPNTDKYEASGVLEYGNYNFLHTEGILNAPLSDTTALRAAFSTAVHDGYLTNGSMDEDTKSARLKALFQPNDKFSLLLTGELNKSGGQGFASVATFDNQDDVDNPWSSRSENAGLGVDMKQKEITASIDWDLGIGSLTIVPAYSTETGYSSGSAQGMAPPGMIAPTYMTTTDRSTKERGIEARITSSEDFPFKWILGGNIHKARQDQSQEQISQTAGSEDRYGSRYNIQRTKAIFGNITYPVTDRFRLTGGLRVSSDSNFTYNYEMPGPGGVETIQSCEISYSSPDYKVGIEYDLSENAMLYADWTTSYRTTGSAASEKPLVPELLTAYTVGSKNRFLGNKLQLNVSAYFYDYQDFLANAPPMMTVVDENNNGVWDYDPVTGEGETTMWFDEGCMQQGDAHFIGFDIQTSTIITANDRLDLSVSYVKKEFVNLVFDYEPITNSLGLPDLDYAGKQMPQAPNWKGTANYNHNFQLGNGGILSLNLDVNYTSKYCINWQAYQTSISIDLETGDYSAGIVSTSDVRWQEAYYIGDASLVYTHPDGKWSISAYGKNIANYAVKRFMDGMGNMFLNNPRTYGAVLSVKY